MIDNTIKAEWTNADALDLQPTCNQLATDCISRQPEKRTKKRTETHACDCISKAMVFEILADIYPTDGEKVVAVKDIDEAYEKILQLPSAQPEIIHCLECVYGEQDCDGWWYCRSFGCQVGDKDGSGFCSDAERNNNV